MKRATYFCNMDDNDRLIIRQHNFDPNKVTLHVESGETSCSIGVILNSTQKAHLAAVLQDDWGEDPTPGRAGTVIVDEE